MPLSRSLARSFCSRLWRNGTILSKADLKKRRNLAIRAPLVESAVGEARKIDPARRKVISPRLKFKIVVLESLHYLSDEQTEYLIRDRLTFMRSLDRGPGARCHHDLGVSRRVGARRAGREALDERATLRAAAGAPVVAALQPL